MFQNKFFTSVPKNNVQTKASNREIESYFNFSINLLKPFISYFLKT